MKYRLLSRDTVYAGWMRVERWRLHHDLFAGGESGEVVRELFVRGDAVVVLPYDPVLDVVVMVEQFRIGATHLAEGPWLLETVAGVVEPGESAETVARREAVEEAGLALGELLPIAEYLPSPGACSETISLFCGLCDASGAGGLHGLDTETEDIRVQVLAAEQAFALVDRRELRSAAPIIALQWLRGERPALRCQPETGTQKRGRTYFRGADINPGWGRGEKN